MGLADRSTRRGILGLISGVFSLSVAQKALAQTAGCEIGFVNGLLTVGGNDCDLFSPPGLNGAQVSAPSHLAGEVVDDTTDTSTSTSDVLTPEERRLRRRDHHQQKKDNNQDHKQDKRNRKQNHVQDKRDRKADCEDFDDQKEAIEWMAQHPEDAKFLDPDGDGIACEELEPVTCADFDSREEAQTWFDKYEPTFTAVDPFNLDPDNDGKACEHEQATCDDFSNQKQAIEWLAQHSKDDDELDPDNDGLACEHLEEVKCNQFSSKSEVQAWLNIYIEDYYHPVDNPNGDDPYNLFRGNPEELCPGLPD